MELILEVRKVFGKNKILVNLLQAVLENPEGKIKDTLFPIVSPLVLKDLIKELKYKQSIYQEKVHWRIRNSYSSSYRTAVINILKTLDFKSNNDLHQPVIQAVELLKDYESSKQINFSQSEQIPLGTEIIPKKWYDLVVKSDSESELKVNRINYEICVLHALRDKLKCREVWIPFSHNYRNPEEYLPPNFEKNRIQHYEKLHLPIEATEKIEDLKFKLNTKLSMLNTTISDNKKVTILAKHNGWISIAPNELALEPKELTYLKKAVSERWWLISLVDIIKEVDLRIEFSSTFKTLATHERLDRKDIQVRLLLCLYGIGTNTGLKRVSAGNKGIKYKDLLYVKRKFIHVENLKAANKKIINAILSERDEQIWGKSPPVLQTLLVL